MFKALGKLKSTKVKKSDRQDEGHQNTNPKSSKTAPKEKDKLDKQRLRNFATKKKKGHTNSTGGEGSAGSSEDVSRPNSPTTVFEDHSDVHRVKGKKQISKECEEAVQHAVSDFFECAWLACAERYFITSAPLACSYELRNTWLRIVEANWQDPEMKEKPSAKKHNRIFMRDEPPLPLAFDSWSRGAIEHLPSIRRESVLDPFLRDLFPNNKFPFSERPPAQSNPPLSQQPSSILESETGSRLDIGPDGLEEEAEQKVEANTEDKFASDQNILEKDKWNFDLDQTIPQQEQDSAETNSARTSHLTSDSKYSQEPPLTSAKSIRILLSARPQSLNESITDVEYYSSPISTAKSTAGKSRKSVNVNFVMKRFSPSQCGGRNGSGIFRLPHETTSEALLTRDNVRTEGPEIEEQNTEDRKDIVQVIKKGQLNQKYQEDEDEPVVEPLFEERERPPRTVGETHRSQQDIWRRPSYIESRFNRGTSLEEVASDINERFLKRRLANLKALFKRQALRSLAARARQVEAEMEEYVQTSSTQLKSEMSTTSLRSSTKSNRTNRSFRSKLENISKRETSQSVSNVNIGTFGKKPSTITSVNRSVAKGAASESQIGKIKKSTEKNNKKNDKGAGSAMKEQKQRQQVQQPSTVNMRRNSNKKNNFFTSSMANVRPSFRDESRTLAGGKFQEMKDNPAQLQSRYENTKRFSTHLDLEKNDDDDCQTTGTCSKNGSPPKL